ncbi:glycoprotein A33 (transmembrane), paralog a [Micropterus salmoides]|uniref:glycoprotein A33 (transmembrane), paralog a n=1 Tax=Micropterus salmoides TaxID=27706 RepID=UPI0018EC2048|nr:glycoprotein A33 (transmembrane), paralog a [Micropterus salmoides]
MEGRISTSILLCLVLSGVGAIVVDIPKDEYEYARGDNITLPCTFTTTVTPKSVTITWKSQGAEFHAKSDTVITYFYPDGEIEVGTKYQGRASLDADVSKGKGDLKLSSITLADNKTFECTVLIPRDAQGITADSASLVVLVAPSTPTCTIQGKAEYGQDITLKCLSAEGSPPPTYKWVSRDTNNMPRALDPRTTDQGGILSLYNISKDTSGYYICTSSNKIRSATCNITLTVMPPSMNIGSTAGIIGAVAAVLIVLVIIIYCCCCRKKNKDEEYAMGLHEDEFHDKEQTTNGERRHIDGQEEILSNDAPNVKSAADRSDRNERDYDDRSDRYEERSERDYDDRRSDYDDRRSDYKDRRSDYDDRRSDYKDRRSDYDDRRSDYKDRRSDYDDRRSDYDDRRSDYSDRRDKNSDRYDDKRRYDDRRDHRLDDDRYDDRDRPPVPALKPPRKDYKD